MTRDEHEAEARDDDAEDAAGGAEAMPCAISFAFAWLVSGAELCSSSQEPIDELVRDVVDHPRQGVDEVPEAPDQRREQEQDEDDAERDQPEHERRRTRAAPHRELPLHQPHDGLEHERGEERQEERHDRFRDVDERPGEDDDDRDQRASCAR